MYKPIPTVRVETKGTTRSENYHDRSCYQAMTSGWWPETIAFAFSTLCFAGLLTLLGIENGKLLSQWTFFLSINTITSILSTGMKAPLAFVVSSCLSQWKWAWFRKRQASVACFVDLDEASRGPLGSLQLLYRMKSWYVRHCLSQSVTPSHALSQSANPRMLIY
jgi:hypothetical protein